MKLTEKSIIDKIEVVENNSIQIRNANVIEKDGVEIARTYHRHILCPGDDVSNEDARVQAIANVIWTEEVVNAYKELIKPIEPTDNNLE